MKKELIRLYKSGTVVQSPGNDSGYSASPIMQSHDNPPYQLQTGSTVSSASSGSPPQLQANSTYPQPALILYLEITTGIS